MEKRRKFRLCHIINEKFTLILKLKKSCNCHLFIASMLVLNRSVINAMIKLNDKIVCYAFFPFK